jgi:hypothetical protein
MHQLGLSVSQPNTRGDFSKGIIKDLNVDFDSFPNAPFTIDVLVIVLVIYVLRNWGRRHKASTCHHPKYRFTLIIVAIARQHRHNNDEKVC